MNSARVAESIYDVQAASKIEAIEKMAACAAGRVCLLDFDSVKARLADRWEAKRADVCDVIGRFIQRTAGRAAIYAVINDSQFIVCFPEEVGSDATGLAYRIMEEVLTHFLGSSDLSDVKVRSVMSLADGQVASRVLTEEEIQAARNPQPHSPAPRPKVTPEPILIEQAAGRLPVLYGLETVVAVKFSSPIGFRLSATFFDEHNVRVLALKERNLLPTASLLAVDLRTLLEARSSGLSGGDYPRVIVPLSIQSFSNSRARAAIFEQLNRLKAEERGRLLVELVGIEDGAPSSRIAETTALLKPFCRATLIHTPPGRVCAANIRAAQPTAVSIEASYIGGDGSKLAAGLLAAGAALKGIAPTLFATGLPTGVFLDVCAVAGFTHATMKA